MALLDSTLVGEAYASPLAGTSQPAVLILGVGNILMGDEGVGVHIIRQIENLAAHSAVRVLDGGTGGVNLLSEFDYAQAIILVDATRDGRPDGTITYLQPERVVDLPRGLGAHDFGLKDLFAASALIERLPQLHLFTISVSTIIPMTTELSHDVALAVPCVASAVHALAAQLAAAFVPPEFDNDCALIANRRAAKMPITLASSLSVSTARSVAS